MRTVRSIIALAALAAGLASGSGCSGNGFWKSKDKGWVVPEMNVSTPGSAPYVKPDKGVVQAGGVSPFGQLPSSFSWMTGKSDKAKTGSGATEIGVGWRNHVDYLPDPVRQGAMGPGLAGQVFLIGARDNPALADGTITVDLYDETVRPAGQQPNRPERWQFKKDVLKSLLEVDERFGPYYGLFLPWPTYRPDITRVRITVRFDPEKGGYPLYAPESKLALENGLKGGTTNTGANPDSPGGLTPAGAMEAPAASTGPGMGVIRMGRRPNTDEPTASANNLPLMPNPPAIGTIHLPHR